MVISPPLFHTNTNFNERKFKQKDKVQSCHLLGLDIIWESLSHRVYSINTWTRDRGCITAKPRRDRVISGSRYEEGLGFPACCFLRQGREKKNSHTRSHSVLSCSLSYPPGPSSWPARRQWLVHRMLNNACWQRQSVPSICSYLAPWGLYGLIFLGGGIRNVNTPGQEVRVTKRKVPKKSGMFLPLCPLLWGGGGVCDLLEALCWHCLRD